MENDVQNRAKVGDMQMNVRLCSRDAVDGNKEIKKEYPAARQHRRGDAG
jgi:hypothetical protein